MMLTDLRSGDTTQVNRILAAFSCERHRFRGQVTAADQAEGHDPALCVYV